VAVVASVMAARVDERFLLALQPVLQAAAFLLSLLALGDVPQDAGDADHPALFVELRSAILLQPVDASRPILGAELGGETVTARHRALEVGHRPLPIRFADDFNEVARDDLRGVKAVPRHLRAHVGHDAMGIHRVNDVVGLFRQGAIFRLALA
jgi:hypothetical protein